MKWAKSKQIPFQSEEDAVPYLQGAIELNDLKEEIGSADEVKKKMDLPLSVKKSFGKDSMGAYSTGDIHFLMACTITCKDRKAGVKLACIGFVDRAENGVQKKAEQFIQPEMFPDLKTL